MFELIQNFKSSTENLFKITNGISESIATFKPAPNKWNILEIIEHIIISDKSGYIAMLKPGPIKTEAEMIESEILFNKFKTNAPTGFIAPDTVIPIGKFANIEEAIENFISVRKKIEIFAEKNDMELMALGFEHPRLGWLSRKEWIRFVTWHANHHAKQIEGLINSTT